jgi:hypothetical protein
MLMTIGHHLGQGSESLAAVGIGDATVDQHDIPTVGVISAIVAALLLTEADRRVEGAAVYRSLGPAATWRPMPHVVLVSYAFGIAVATSLSATNDVAVLRDLLSPHRGHHVVSGAGPVSYGGPVELWLGKGGLPSGPAR